MKLSGGFMKKLMVCGAIFSVAHCMGVQVPEDYLADIYYGKPKVVAISASTSTSLSSVPIQVKFGSPMSAVSVTVNTANTNCDATIQFSTLADNFSTCLPFNSVSSEKRDSVFTAILTNDIDPNSNYLVKVLNTATDIQGATLGEDKIFSFKSEVPPGSEPRTNSVVFGKKLSPGDITVQFQPRPMDGNSITVALAKDCNDSGAIFILMDPNGNCVNGGTNTTPGNLTTYTINYSLTVVGSYTMVVKPGLTDQLGISTIVTYTISSSNLN
jgi:hypothetical protein